jgi:hypothetical protein
MKKLTFEIHEMTGFGEVSKEKYLRALDKLILAINSEEFKQRVINYQYTNNGEVINNFKLPEVDSKFMTRQEIYDLIMSGKDKFNTEADGDIDIKIELYNKRFSSAVGYTYPNTFKTWVNYKFFSNFSEADVAGNIAHEYMHNLGFDHAFNSNPTRKYTVPYAIGTIIRDIIEGKEDNQKEYELVCRKVWWKLWLGSKCYWVKK